VNAVGLLDEGAVGGSDEEDYCRRLRKSGYVLGLSLDTYVLRHASAKPVADKQVRHDSRKRNNDHPDIYD
jgi:GT2 family glycosyltransferase